MSAVSVSAALLGGLALFAFNAGAQVDSPLDSTGRLRVEMMGAVPTADLAASASLLDDPVANALSPAALDALHASPRRNTLGPAASQIYRQRSPSVVLVAVKGGLGSGSLVDSEGNIVTNWHVIRGFPEVGVIFKPQEEGTRLIGAEVVRARVVRVDEVADLALLHVDRVPTSIEPMPLGQPQEVLVGADVHAIGHPAGEQWTYTRGVSQRRLDHEWSDVTGKHHVANVVQTQTPINPGNSGGPLISDEGRLIGVNPFKRDGNENLNFAISIDEVRRFLGSTRDRLAASAPHSGAGATTASAECTTRRETSRGRSPDGAYDYVRFDLTCRGRTDMELRVPVDTPGRCLPCLTAMQTANLT